MENKDTSLILDMISSLTKTVNQRFDKLEERISKLEGQNAVDHKQLEERISKLEGQNATDHKQLEERIGKLEGQNAIEHKQLMQAIKEIDTSKLNKDAKFKLVEIK